MAKGSRCSQCDSHFVDDNNPLAQADWLSYQYSIHHQGRADSVLAANKATEKAFLLGKQHANVHHKFQRILQLGAMYILLSTSCKSLAEKQHHPAGSFCVRMGQLKRHAMIGLWDSKGHPNMATIQPCYFGFFMQFGLSRTHNLRANWVLNEVKDRFFRCRAKGGISWIRYQHINRELYSMHMLLGLCLMLYNVAASYARSTITYLCKRAIDICLAGVQHRSPSKAVG